jgi:hypothetical protein
MPVKRLDSLVGLSLRALDSAPLMSGLGGRVGFDAFALVDPLLNQPLLIIAGADAGSRWHSEELCAGRQARR